MADFVSIVQIAPNFVIINLESRFFRFSMKTFTSTAAVRQSYHRPVVALPLGSGRRKDGHL